MAKLWNRVDNSFYEATDFKDTINMSAWDIIAEIRVLHISYEDLVNNFDRFVYITDIMIDNGYNTVCVDDYKSLKFINEQLKDHSDLMIHILDDFQNKSRNEIHKSEIDKVEFSVPLSYMMWGIDFDNLMYVNLTSYHQNPLNYNGNRSISLDVLKRIKDIIAYLKSLGHFNDLQIIILVSNYLQKNVEYLAENVDTTGRYTAIVDNPIEGLEDEVGLVETVLFKKFGLCTGISNATTLLLNNPTFKIDARSVFNLNHAFNIIKYNGKYYFLDNTWAITRSPKEFAKATKPVEFNPLFILFGKKYFDYAGNNIFLCDNPNIELVEHNGIKERDILEAKRRMMDRVSFKYPGDIVHPITKKAK